MTVNARDNRQARQRFRRARAAGVALLALAPGFGCAREFYREWANQDVSEAVFEKSRDPRWRLDMFSIEPPAMSRFANPYDPDRPPAPPDDFASQVLNPVPQWPDNRLIVPTEGTGYLDMLDEWQRDQPVKREEDNQGLRDILRDIERVRPRNSAPATTPTAPPPATPSPFGRTTNPPADGGDAATNPGTGAGGTTPTPVPPAPTPPSGPAGTGPQARNRWVDLKVRLTAHQDTNIPPPVPPPSTRGASPAQRPDEVPSVTGPELPEEPRRDNLAAPENVRPDEAPGTHAAIEAETAEMAGILQPGALNFDEALTAGLPTGSNPYLVTPEQAMKLGLINARAYQYQLELVYLAALSVTAQRFVFEPQFVAGLNPGSGTAATSAGLPASLPAQFLYRTKTAPGGEASTLTLGTVAGFGKVFTTGARLLGGFADQVVFNFIGHNSKQPTVQSFLPLSIAQPFLRGGGRAVTLEPLTSAERSLLYQIRLFARFRQEFFASIMVGQSNITNPGLNDPSVGYLFVVQQLQEVENDRLNVAAYERFLDVFRELLEGESSGLTRLQIDQLDGNLQSAKLQFLTDQIQYRNFLDQFKFQLGMPPDMPMTLERGILAGFREGYARLNAWAANARRRLEDLDELVAQLPGLNDVMIDNRSVLELGGVDPSTRRELTDHPEKLEDLLLAGQRVMLENRLDVMNARAQLYDQWRQLRVAENALRGVFTVSITNQIFTPTDTTNPFAFLSNAKQFALVLDAELPLVRVNERNNFRTQLINYERQRRALMNAEDTSKFQVRQDIRNLQLQAQSYVISKRRFLLVLRQKDQAQEQLIAPPQGGGGAAAGGGGAQGSSAAIQTQNLIQAQSAVLQSQNQLLQTWINYETQRVILYKDLGTMPFDEWEAYYELFPRNAAGRYSAPGAVARVDAGPRLGSAAGPGAGRPEEVARP